MTVVRTPASRTLIISGERSSRRSSRTPRPETLGAMTVRISLDVDDPDALAAQAIAAGAREIVRTVADQPME